MFLSFQHFKKKKSLAQSLTKKNKNEYSFDEKLNSNKNIINNNLIESNYSKNNQINEEKNNDQFYNTISQGFLSNKKFANLKKTIKIKDNTNEINYNINNSKKNSKNNNNISLKKNFNSINSINYCKSPSSSIKKEKINSIFNRITKYNPGRTSYSFSKDQPNIENRTLVGMQNKIIIDSIKRRKGKENQLSHNDFIDNYLTPSEINYSPKFFDSYIFKSSKNNKKIENFKSKIFLSTKKHKLKRKNKIKNLINKIKSKEKNEDSISFDRNFLKIKPFSKDEKNLKSPKIEFRDKKTQNREDDFSPSPNNIFKPTIKKNDTINNNNNLIGNLFTNKKKMFHAPEKKFLNNLNIIYSENEAQFDRKYLNHITRKELRGLCLTHINSSPKIIKNNLNSKINLVKDKLSLVKSIIDYTYPEIIIRRSMKQTNNFIKKFSRNIIPYKLELLKYQTKEQQMNNYYSSLLQIFNSANNNI